MQNFAKMLRNVYKNKMSKFVEMNWIVQLEGTYQDNLVQLPKLMVKTNVNLNWT